MLAACAGSIIAGCEVGPSYHAPEVQAPVAFDLGPQMLPTTFPVSSPTSAATTTQPTAARNRNVAAATQAATRVAAKPVNLERWWDALDDTELNSLIQRAAGANYDVGIAVLRVQEARSLYSAASGADLPALDASAGVGRGSGSNDTKGRVGQPLNAGTNTAGYKEITEVGGFDASWELDLFGGERRAIEAAGADVQTAVEERNQVLVTVFSDVARNYIGVRSTQLRLRITQDNIAALRRTVDLTRSAFHRGIGNELNVVLAERQLSAALARVGPLDAQVRQAERRIAVLLGLNPQDLYAELDRPAGIPAMAAEVDPGLPLELVRRRPDIRTAERQLASATARIGVATAALFPDVALTGGLGFEGQGLGADGPVQYSDVWSIGPAFRLPLLDFGRLDALVKVQDYRTQAQLLRYRRMVSSAVEDVENALSSYLAERNRFDNLTVAVASSQRAVNLSTQQFRLGLTDFLNVLDAQRQLYDLEDQLASSQQTVSTELVALFKSLGGGWEGFQTLPAPPKVHPAIVAAIGSGSDDRRESQVQDGGRRSP